MLTCLEYTGDCSVYALHQENVLYGYGIAMVTMHSMYAMEPLGKNKNKNKNTRPASDMLIVQTLLIAEETMRKYIQ